MGERRDNGEHERRNAAKWTGESSRHTIPHIVFTFKVTILCPPNLIPLAEVI